jgi:hypothetical protein
MTMTDQPLDHVLRPQPPWRRSQHVTECGKPAEGRRVISRDEFLAKVRRQGQQRSAMSTCMTCWRTARDNPSWDENPVASLLRETRRFEWAARGRFARADQFRDELLAIAELVERHRDEFDAILASLGDTVRLADARQRRRRA